MAIVAILGALLATAIANGTMVAQRTSCASNMRQIGIALLGYANDNTGNLPETTHTEGLQTAWIEVLKPYLNDVDRVRISPADPKGDQRLKTGGTSYILNSMVFVPRLDPFGRPMGVLANNIYRIPILSKTITTFLISDDRGVGVTNDHTHSEGWTGGWGKILYDIEPDRHRIGSRAADRLKGSSNYLYADGHVENLAAKQLKALSDAGLNPAAVPGPP